MWVPNPALLKLLEKLDTRLALNGPVAVLKDLGQHAQQFPENDALSAEQRALLLQVLEAVQGIMQQQGSSETALVVELMILGKLGQFEKAVRRAKKAFEEHPTWPAAIAAGNALRRAGKRKEAVEMFTAAAELDKADVTALLEVGDMELEAGRHEDALAAYEGALKREKAQAWALPSSWYCRYLLTREKKWLNKLQTAATALKDECGVEAALSGLLGEYSEEQKRSRAEYLLQKRSGGQR